MQKKFEIGFLNLLKQNFNLDQEKLHLFLACSGGVDSVVLLDLLSRFCKKKKNFRLSVIYIDHRIRADTKQDIAVIEKMVQKNPVPFIKSSILKLAKPTEENLRVLRYKKLSQILKKRSSALEKNLLITAHHADDQVETFLLKLFRGMHVKTYPGIRPLNTFQKPLSFTVLRPLLAFWKSELYEYAKEKSLVWNEDSTNKSLHFNRNRLRLEILPQIESLRMGSKKNIFKFCQSLCDELHLENPKEKQKNSSMEKNARALKKEGLLSRQISFEELKESTGFLLGAKLSKTHTSQWKTIEILLLNRQKTKQGGGETKLVKLPGKNFILFKKDRIFFNPK